MFHQSNFEFCYQIWKPNPFKKSHQENLIQVLLLLNLMLLKVVHKSNRKIKQTCKYLKNHTLVYNLYLPQHHFNFYQN